MSKINHHSSEPNGRITKNVDPHIQGPEEESDGDVYEWDELTRLPETEGDDALTEDELLSARSESQYEWLQDHAGAVETTVDDPVDKNQIDTDEADIDAFPGDVLDPAADGVGDTVITKAESLFLYCYYI